MKTKLLLTALAMASLFSNPLQAQAPLAAMQAPGFYRMMLGNFEVTVLSDGTVDLPMDQLLQQDAAKTTESMHAHHLSVPTETSVNAYLINTGNKLILVDAGAGALFGPTLGKVASNLQASGYTPEQVDEIYISHMHPDHVGGLTANGKAVFPNAVVKADKQDADFWLSAEQLAKAPEAQKGFFQGAQASLKPYLDSGHFKTFSGKTTLTSGVEAQTTYGHTPGHISYLVKNEQAELLLMGDLIHAAAVQFDAPEVTIGFDSTPEQAKQQRLNHFKYSAANGQMVAGSHLQFPGMGYLTTKGQGYSWIPVNYSRLR